MAITAWEVRGKEGKISQQNLEPQILNPEPQTLNQKDVQNPKPKTLNPENLDSMCYLIPGRGGETVPKATRFRLQGLGGLGSVA